MIPKPPMDRQDVFDTVAEHLIQQGKAAVSANSPDGFENCKYRTQDGRKCAVGALIPDSAYNPNIEGFVVADAMVQESLPFLVEDITDETILSRLQRAHDDSLRYGGLSEWYEYMLLVAAEFDLDPTFLQKRFAEKRASEEKENG